MPMAAQRNTKARLPSTERASAFEKIVATVVVKTSTAPVANHLSCSRSSPTDPRNRATSAAKETASDPTTGRRNTNRSTNTFMELSGDAWPKGSDHDRAARTVAVPVFIVKAPPTNHAAGRHRAE